ncbi:repeat protein [Seminavis robusta]|uniref:Repeat protein n=1 Tax=Seminavis robusta TaxID=568900 RepID=A0A9N8EBE6_9STRA|nr:repeat protein [Seminavis robusta]|eukprot:Sro764_g199110.1 repeat protein (345) ;mRNA; r:42104-43211
MFVKKDHRKIPRILADGQKAIDEKNEDDYLRDLRLARRQNELNGDVRILCQPQSAAPLQHLETLSLYDCQISNLNGIGMLEACPKLQTLNLGRNPLGALPEEISKLAPSLKELLLDDCGLEGSLAPCILELENLEILRLSNNKITELPRDICLLTKLQVLALDRNQLESVPSELQDLTDLKTLLLRHNQIEELPDGVPGSSLLNLTLLHISSNKLKALPDSLVDCTTITHLYANSNQIKQLPIGMERMTNLQRLNLGHNQIESLPSDFIEAFGEPERERPEALCVGGKNEKPPEVVLVGNQVIKAKRGKTGGQDDVVPMDIDPTSTINGGVVEASSVAIETTAA